MFSIFQAEQIKCLSCGASMRGPQVGQLATCPKCKSRIVASYKKLSFNYYMGNLVGGISLMAASVLMIKFSGFRQEVSAGLFIVLALTYSLLMNKLHFGRWFVLNPKMAIEYKFVSGTSYKDEIKLRRKLLLSWIEKADSDFIGFIRYLFNTDYVWESLDDQSQGILMEIHARTDTLPDHGQLSGWSPAKVTEDLRCIDTLKAEYLSALRPLIEELKGSPLDYQA